MGLNKIHAKRQIDKNQEITAYPIPEGLGPSIQGLKIEMNQYNIVTDKTV